VRTGVKWATKLFHLFKDYHDALKRSEATGEAIDHLAVYTKYLEIMANYPQAGVAGATVFPNYHLVSTNS